VCDVARRNRGVSNLFSKIDNQKIGNREVIKTQKGRNTKILRKTLQRGERLTVSKDPEQSLQGTSKNSDRRQFVRV
jgi:hypothetical protein